MQVRSGVNDATVAFRRGLPIVGALLALGVSFVGQGRGSSGSGGSRHLGSSVRLEGRVVDGSGSLAALSGVRARDLTLKDCGNCVDAQGTADVSLASVDGDLSCESSGNGIDAGGTRNVRLSSAGELSIEAGGDHAIAATGNATVAIESPVSCRVHGRHGAIHAQGSATVTTAGCFVLDSGEAG